MNIQNWQACTSEEVIREIKRKASEKTKNRKSDKGSILAVRKNLSPVDVYCYLKARFGEPNGFLSFLRKNDSDNLIHWDFNLKADNEEIYISGASREIHFMLSEKLTDKEWMNFIQAIKADFKRLAQEKSVIQKSLERVPN
jgi:hypothetical protein